MMKKWNIKVEMNLRCCVVLISRYYEGIEAETFEQAEKIAFHKFIQDAIIPRTITAIIYCGAIRLHPRKRQSVYTTQLGACGKSNCKINQKP